MPLALPKSRAEITAVRQDRKVAAVRNALRAPFHKQRLKGVDPEQMTGQRWKQPRNGGGKPTSTELPGKSR